MTQCPVCNKVYDESEYTHCPYCSGELSDDNHKEREVEVKLYDKKLGRYRWVPESEYNADPDRYEN